MAARKASGSAFFLPLTFLCELCALARNKYYIFPGRIVRGRRESIISRQDAKLAKESQRRTPPISEGWSTARGLITRRFRRGAKTHMPVKGNFHEYCPIMRRPRFCNFLARTMPQWP